MNLGAKVPSRTQRDTSRHVAARSALNHVALHLEFLSGGAEFVSDLWRLGAAF